MKTAPEDRDYVIIGAGPTGLGAALRLVELGAQRVRIYEAENHVGGLAASFRDDKGFTWDLGGHVQFSHYTYFDELMDSLLKGEWLHHERESWVWMRQTFIPYPFQNNIRHLPEKEKLDCLLGALRLQGGPPPDQFENFEEWIYAIFGAGIARHFMIPYNFKVWGYPPCELTHHWVGDRVSRIDTQRILSNMVHRRDDVSWGPNNTFRFPQSGGTGEIWRRLSSRLPAGSIHLGRRIEKIDSRRRVLSFADGSQDSYDVLISTMPVDLLVGCAGLDGLTEAAANLHHSTVHVVGVGLQGAPPPHLKTKCWMYFPESDNPFYRATVFSNYSPNNVPDASENWSLMLEVSESPKKPIDRPGLEDSVVRGLRATGLKDDPSRIIDIWKYTCEYGYPTPSLSRDKALERILPELESLGIYSRGRFGAWKYEVSNQDHSLMQGVELANRLIKNEDEVTLNDPNYINRPR